MTLKSCRAVFMRGGTSKALVFRESDLPRELPARNALFLAAMGSPDANMRQLDGMGGGVSSLSKVCVVGPASRDDADVDFTFAQIWIDRAEVDYAGTCGNMSSAIGPFAVDEGLVPAAEGQEGVVRVHNTNTGKVFVARFPVRHGRSLAEGDLAIDGVAGTSAPVRLDFTDPGGSATGRLLPSGNASDVLDIPGHGPVRVTMIDAANPCVFLRAADVGLTGTEQPAAMERDAVLMGLLAAPIEQTVLSGRVMAADESDIVARMISVGQPHRATPLTAALCLAVACRIPGTVAQALVREIAAGQGVRIGHASGSIMVGAEVVTENGVLHVPHATVFRTQRRLFQGEVLYRTA